MELPRIFQASPINHIKLFTCTHSCMASSFCSLSSFFASLSSANIIPCLTNCLSAPLISALAKCTPWLLLLTILFVLRSSLFRCWIALSLCWIALSLCWISLSLCWISLFLCWTSLFRCWTSFWRITVGYVQRFKIYKLTSVN